MGSQGEGGIVWCHETWNPIRGCSRMSAGCSNCYAERVAARFSGPGQPYAGLARMTPKGPAWTGKVAFVPEHLEDPIRWKRPRRIFVNSMSDLFHDAVEMDWIVVILDAMRRAPQHRFQVLTKRPETMADILTARPELMDGLGHVWWGTSVENQEVAEARLEALAFVPSPNRWVSAEPLIGPLDLSPWLGGPPTREVGSIGWVVAGGESGPYSRAMAPSWARDLRDQCREAGVPFLFKQWGEWAPEGAAGYSGNPDAEPTPTNEPLVRIGKKKAGRVLDGVTHDGYPAGMVFGQRTGRGE